MNSRVYRLVLICFATSLFVLPVWLVARSGNFNKRSSSQQVVQSTPEQIKHKRQILPPYGFSEITPGGTWSAVADFDNDQTHDPDVPVGIVAMDSYAGKGAWAKQLMVDNVVLRNNSKDQVKSVQLGWIILSAKDKKEVGKNRSAALRERFTKDLPISVLPGKMNKVHNLHIDFVKETGDLIQSGKINGLTFIYLRVAEVTFVNESIWKERTAIAKRLHHKTTRPPQAFCPNVGCIFHDNGQGYCEIASIGNWCRREDCSPDDPQACFCRLLECTACQDRDHDGVYDCEGDCDETDPTVNPDALEYYPISNCSDGKDNDCDAFTEKDCLGFLCRNTAPSCSPTPSPSPTQTAGLCGGVPDYSTYPTTGCATGFTVLGGVCNRSQTFQGRCAGPTYYDPASCSCPDGVDPSPIIIDVDNSGFLMSSAAQGVIFNMLNDGVPIRLAWTIPDSTNALLALDRNNNGKIDDGTELFGDITPQSPSTQPNGFLALAEYDKNASGGNSDGRIDSRDAIFARLRLWQDFNHNGVSETEELHALPELGVAGIDLDFKESKWIDQNGNQFRYRAKVYATHGVRVARWAWDVFLKPGL
jgi:hypothetical protein